MRTRLALLLLLGLIAAPRAARADLEGELDALVAEAGTAQLGVLVEDLKTKRRLYAHHAEKSLVPASNMKLITTAAALNKLGPEFAHETRLLLVGAVEGQALQGDLWVVGGGDPTISLRFDSQPLLADWAQAVAGAGVRRVSGDLVCDDRAFAGPRLHPGWEASDAERWYGAEVSALSLNDNCIDVSVSGGPTVKLAPDTRYVTVEVLAKSVSDKKRHVFSLLRTGDDKRTLKVKGRVWSRAQPWSSSVPVADPALFFGTVLREQLEVLGVQVAGKVRRPRPEERPGEARAVHTRRAPLARTLEVTNQRSQNFYAESLLKTLGRLGPGGRLGEGGSWERGAKVAHSFARSCGAKAKQVVVDDGSGLSRGNRASPLALVRVLRAAVLAPSGALFRDSLAQPGKPGTLRRRLRSLPPGVRLRAKTGTLTGVHALSGVLETGERRLVFSLLVNGKAGRRTLDRIVQVLAAHLARSG